MKNMYLLAAPDKEKLGHVNKKKLNTMNNMTLFATSQIKNNNNWSK